MVYVEVTVLGYEAGAVAGLGAAVAPAKLMPAMPRPADFDQFWDAKLKALAAVLIDPVLTPVESPIRPSSFSVALRSVGSTARAWLAKPKRPGPYPALVLLQWAGVYKLTPKSAVDRAAEGWLHRTSARTTCRLDQEQDLLVPRRYGDAGALAGDVAS